jgi:K+-transporting ATPase ATPase C chain
MKGYLRPVIVIYLMLSILTGVVYPLVVTAVGQWVFPVKAGGSLINIKGKMVGSELIGQPFDDPKYFWGRPSSTPDFPYNAASSSGSNLGPSNPALAEAVKVRVKGLLAADPENRAPIPIDLITASGSGLDPHISPAAAFYQVSRVARTRRLPEDRVRRQAERFIEPRQLGLLGKPRVNVLKLNLALDRLSSGRE